MRFDGAGVTTEAMAKDSLTAWRGLTHPKTVREELGVSQSEFATLLGVSLRTVQSCEQGWRKPSDSLERMLVLVLLAHRQGSAFGRKDCWIECACPSARRASCLAYRTRQGHLCWLMTGTHCMGGTVRTWADKKRICGKCSFFAELRGTPLSAAARPATKARASRPRGKA